MYALLGAMLLTLFSVALQAAPLPAYVEGEVLVDFVPGSNANSRAAARRNARAAQVRPLSKLSGTAQRWKLKKGMSVEEALKRLRNNPNVRYAEPNFIVKHTNEANDPDYLAGLLWGMYGDATAPNANVYGSQAGEAWAAGFTGSSAVYIGVIDEGLQVDHPDLAPNVWVNPGEIADNNIDDDGNGFVDDVHGWDFFNNDNSVFDLADGDNHGTHVAGTIGARGNDGYGVAGVNWAVTLISGKFLGPNGGSIADAVEAVDYFTALKLTGVNIVATSNSWGGGGYSFAMQDALNRAGDAGILFIAAAGNSNSNNDGSSYYPANYQCTGDNNNRGWDCVIAVASITSSGAKSSFSSYGATTVDLGAPGSSIKSTVGGGGYSTYSGTSMATPHVSGAVALCAAVNPTLPVSTIRDRLMETAIFTPSLDGITVTNGRLDAAALAFACAPNDPLTGGPSGLVAQAQSDSTIQLDWIDSAENEAGFDIQIADGSCVNFASVGTASANSTQTVVTGLDADTEYCFQLTAFNYFDGGQTSSPSNTVSARTQAPPPPYICDVADYAWIDMAGATALSLADDGSSTVTLPFAVPFYGTLTDTLAIASNGFIQFGGFNSTQYTNATIPDSSLPNGIAAPLWDDLNPSAGGTVRHQVVGAAPNRVFVTAWEGVPHYSTSNGVSVQVQVAETNGAISFHYQDVDFGNSVLDWGLSATVGIENANGDAGTLISFNNASLGNAQAYTCAPDGGSSGNNSPAASFTYVATDLRVDFTDTSTDPDADEVVSWNWDFGDGNTSTEQSPSHTYLASGNYTVTLVVGDGELLSPLSSQEIVVTEPNLAPTANFSAAVTDLSVNFTDTSTDPNGNETLVSWSWDFGDGGSSDVSNPSHAYTVAGTYTVTLQVSDGELSDSVSQEVIVTEPPNEAPTADFSFLVDDLSVAFSDTSTDPNGDDILVSWSWSFGDGNTSTAQNPSHDYAAAGTYTVTLTVSDGELTSAVASQSVTVTEPNVAPSASFTQSVTDLSVDFTDTSTDTNGNGTLVSWSWSFGDGNTSTVQNPSHDYAAAGTYTATLTVSDGELGDSISQQVIVTEPPNQAPTSEFTVSVSELTATFTDASSDPEDGIVNWNWDFGDGSTSTAQNPSHDFAAAGTYTVTLTVSDGELSDSSNQPVTVVAPVADTVTIISAQYRADRGELKVRATSSSQPDATLELAGFGQMTFKRDRYEIKIRGVGVDQVPAVAVVTSSEGGSASAPIDGAPQPSTPGQVTNPSPANGSLNIAVTPILSWQSGSGTDSSDVYFGVAGDLRLVGSGIAGSSFTPDELTLGTTYEWRINGRNAQGITEGPLWSFTTTEPPAPPQAASNPTPADQANEVALTPMLTWQNGSNTTANDVYFGPSGNVTLRVQNLDNASYNPGELDPDTTYQWYVVSKNADFPGEDATSAVWSFTTRGAEPADVISITKAEWKGSRDQLKVEATSSGAPEAILTLDGYGVMTYDAGKNKYKADIRGVTSNPGSVTVSSSLGGTATSSVRSR